MAFAALTDALAYARQLAKKHQGSAQIVVDRAGQWPIVRRRDGQTLIEMVVVLAISSVLASSAMSYLNRPPTAKRLIADIHAAERWGASNRAIRVYTEHPPMMCPPAWTCAVRGRMPVPGGFLGYTVTLVDPTGAVTTDTR